MNYKRIKMEYRYSKNRLNRTIFVREDINLIELGCAMCTAIGAAFEHNFQFIKGKTRYSPDAFMVWGWEDKDEVPMKEYSLSDLGDKFSFLYDTGDYWLFDCKVYKREVQLVDGNIAFLVDGVGQGIWEDNVYTLSRYLNGELDPECKEDEEEGIYFPWNFEIEKLSDFDTKFNIAEEKEIFDSTLDDNIEIYLEGMHEAGFELEVEPRTCEVIENHYRDDGAESSVNIRLNTLVMNAVDEQIKSVDYVNSKYQELVKKYGDLTARNKIGEVLVTVIYDVMTSGKPTSDLEFKKKIEKIR